MRWSGHFPGFPSGSAAWLLATGLVVQASGPVLADVTVEMRQVEDHKAVLATVASVDTTVARTRIGGTIEDLGVDEGDQVKQGEVLAKVDDPKLPLKLSALEAQIASLKSELELAEIELKRARQLRETGSGTQARLDQALSNRSVVSGQLASAEAERDVVAEQLAEGEVLAPNSGRVLRVYVTEGQVVLSGEQVVTIALDQYVIRLELPERHARFLREGDRVMVGARGLAVDTSELHPGTIRQVYPELESGRVIADVEAEGIGDFFVGERTRVFVSTGQREAIVVPRELLTHRHGLTFAHVRDVGDVVVQVGQEVGSEIEILSGLRPGDVLVAP
jgi:RND family efflux transporter MFP subunit